MFLVFDKSSAGLVLKSRDLIKLANLVAFKREDGSFEVLKDSTGVCRPGSVVPYSRLTMIMSNIMFEYLYRRASYE